MEQEAEICRAFRSASGRNDDDREVLHSRPDLQINLLSEVQRAEVERLGEALHVGDDGRNTLEAARNLSGPVVPTPRATGKGSEIELVGKIAALIARDVDTAERKRPRLVLICLRVRQIWLRGQDLADS